LIKKIHSEELVRVQGQRRLNNNNNHWQGKILFSKGISVKKKNNLSEEKSI
jgi:hypothetical protein